MGLLWERLKDGSAKMFFSDPPYAQPELYGRLAELAAAKLVPGGLCLAYASRACLIEVTRCDAEAPGLLVVLRGVRTPGCLATSTTDTYKTSGNRSSRSGGRPSRCRPSGWGISSKAAAGTRAHHPWGQPVSEARYFVTRLTEAGDLVVDPFVGGGTVPSACKASGRRWLATEIDEGTVAVARKRLADMGKLLLDQRAVASGHGEDGSLDGNAGTNREPA